MTFGLSKHGGDFIQVGVRKNLKEGEEMVKDREKPQSTETLNDNMECVTV